MGSYLLQNSLLIVLFIFVNSVKVISAYDCPYDWSFPSCPRPLEDSRYTVCCRINDIDTCCNEDTLTAWAITFIVVGVLVVLGIVIAAVLCCCGMCNAFVTCCCKPKRKEYVVIRDDHPAAGYTTTTAVYPAYAAPPPGAAPPNMAPPMYSPPQTDAKLGPPS